jgi:hypothetical protein
MADKDPSEKKSDWLGKIITPLVTGAVLAAIGFLGNNFLTTFSARQENARLITELQIKREEGETNMRQNVFEQTINTLLRSDGDSPLEPEARMLRLELLAQNFGDSFSLSPLFKQFDRELAEQGKNSGQKLRADLLRDRLRGIAKQLSGNQVATLSRVGQETTILIPLRDKGNSFESFNGDNGDSYIWPDYQLKGFIDPESNNSMKPYICEPPYSYCSAKVEQGLLASLRRFAFCPSEDEKTIQDLINEQCRDLSELVIDDKRYYVRVELGDLDASERTVDVTLWVCPEPVPDSTGNIPDCKGNDFTLDFYNFPLIDNTRFADNQRLSMVLRKFKTGNDNSPYLEISLSVFPNEYASLRDRPSMSESVQMLKRVLNNQESP